MTIEERVEELCEGREVHPGFKRDIRTTLLETAKDQREACALAAATVIPLSSLGSEVDSAIRDALLK